jgi:hypothetical protein
VGIDDVLAASRAGVLRLSPVELVAAAARSDGVLVNGDGTGVLTLSISDR